MNEFYTKHGDWLIPVLCLLVIFQTVMLLGSSGRVDRVVEVLPGAGERVVEPTPVPLAAKIEMVPQALTVVKGKTVKIEVWLKPERPITLGGMDLVLKFDPKFGAVSKIETSKTFSLVIPNRQSEKNGRLFITYLDEGGKGVVVDEAVKMADITLTAKQAGNLNLSVVSSSEGATTVLAEKSSSNSLPFTAGNLTIVVGEK